MTLGSKDMLGILSLIAQEGMGVFEAVSARKCRKKIISLERRICFLRIPFPSVRVYLMLYAFVLSYPIP